jgi:hypothetical protein
MSAGTLKSSPECFLYFFFGKNNQTVRVSAHIQAPEYERIATLTSQIPLTGQQMPRRSLRNKWKCSKTYVHCYQHASQKYIVTNMHHFPTNTIHFQCSQENAHVNSVIISDVLFLKVSFSHVRCFEFLVLTHGIPIIIVSKNTAKVTITYL